MQQGPDADRAAAGDQTGQVRPSAPQDVYHPFQPARSVFADICGVLPLAAIVLLYVPYVSGPYVIGLLVAVALVALAGPLFQMHWGGRGVTLSAEGISVGKRSAKWQELAEIRRGASRTGFIRLHVHGCRRARFRLPASPMVLRELLPAVVAQCPGIAISERVRRAMADPEAATVVGRWAAAALLPLAGIVVAVPIVARCADLRAYLAMAAALAFLPIAAVLLLGGLHTTQHRFVFSAVESSSWIGWALLPTLYFDVPPYVVDALAAVAAALLVAAAVVVAARAKLNMWRKALVLACVGFAPLLLYDRGTRLAWPRTDLRPLLVGQPYLSSLLWSREGQLITDVLAGGIEGDEHRVVDLANRRVWVLPRHEESQWAWWVGPTGVVRTVRTASACIQQTLFLYRFADEREVRIAGPAKIRLSAGNCVSPDGRLLCWLQWPRDRQGRPGLKVYDLNREGIEDVQGIWPDRADIAWAYCSWLDDRTLGLYGSDRGKDADPNEPWTLHVLRIDYATRAVEYAASALRFQRWRPSPDLRRAFAISPGGDDDSGVHHVDLRAGRSILVGGAELPIWTSDSHWAFRLRDLGSEGRWLSRFDVQAAAETRLLRISDDQQLLSVSPQGRLALLMLRGWRMWPLLAVDLATGRRHRLGVPTLASSLFYESCDFQSVFTSLSPWSPDERRLVLSTPRPLAPTFSTYLHRLPPGWPAHGPTTEEKSLPEPASDR